MSLCAACARAPGGPLCPTGAERVSGQILPCTPVLTATASEAGGRVAPCSAMSRPSLLDCLCTQMWPSACLSCSLSGRAASGDLGAGSCSQDSAHSGEEAGGPFWWGATHVTTWASFLSPEGTSSLRGAAGGEVPPSSGGPNWGPLGALQLGVVTGSPVRGACHCVQHWRMCAGRSVPLCLANLVPASGPRFRRASP